jgi:transposase
MRIVYARCCELDVHKKSISACLLTPHAKGGTQQEVRRFGAMTRDLLLLSDWLSANQVTHVAMESTGVYWKPVWNILEEHYTILLVNAQHVKAVPGRKTDTNDCQWIADLLQHGSFSISFGVPGGLDQPAASRDRLAVQFKLPGFEHPDQLEEDDLGYRKLRPYRRRTASQD